MIAHYKILHATAETQWEQKEKRILSEAIWMKNKGHKIIIISPIATPLYQKAKSLGLKVYDVPFNWLSKLSDLKAIDRILYNEKPDIVNTHGDKDSKLVLKAAKKREVPLRIRTKHTDSGLNSFFNRMGTYKKNCHYLFTASPQIREALLAKFNLRDLEVFSIPGEVNFGDAQKVSMKQIDPMGRDIIRIYRLHQVKIDRRLNTLDY